MGNGFGLFKRHRPPIVVAPPVAPINHIAPVISGIAQVPNVLTCDGGSWSGSPALAYQWQRDGVNIDGETASTYTLDAADVGADITCDVTATNPADSTGPVSSNAIGPIVAQTVLAVLTLSAATVAEGAAAGTVIGAIQGRTPGSEISLVDDAGGMFALSGLNIVTTAVATDFETDASPSITVRETLTGATNTPKDTALEITVTNVLEAATLVDLALSSDSLNEDVAEDTFIGTFLNAKAGSVLTLQDDAGGLVKLSGSVLLAGAVATDFETAQEFEITVRETLDDSPNSPHDTVLTIHVNNVVEGSEPVPFAPILTLTSQPGDNPPAWDAQYVDLILGRDTVRLNWRVDTGAGFGAWNEEDHLVTEADLINGEWDWPGFQAAAPFADTTDIEIREFLVRDAGDPGELVSAASNVLSYTIEGVTTGLYVAEGDSITAWAGSYPNQWLALRPGYTLSEIAVGGATINSMNNEIDTVLDQDPEFFTVFAGANDLAKPAYTDGADYAETVLTYTDQIRAGGAKVGVCTILPTYIADQPAWTAEFAARRPVANEAIRTAFAEGRIDAVIDFAADPIMGPDEAAQDVTLFHDGLHPSDTGPYSGKSRLGGIAIPAIDTLVGYPSDTTPDAFAIPAQTGVATDTVITSVAVTPVGYDTPTSISVVGGEIEVNGCGRWSAADIIKPGHTFKVRTTSSAVVESTPVIATVTIGGVEADFSVTTEEVSATGATFTASSTQPATISGGSATYTDIDFEDGNALVIIGPVNGTTANLVSVTLDGVAMNKRVTCGTVGVDTLLFLYELPVAAGLHDVFIDRSGSANIPVMFGTLQNADPVPSDSATLAWGSRASPQDASSQLDVAAGGLGVVMVAKSSAINFTGLRGGITEVAQSPDGLRKLCVVAGSGTPGFTASALGFGAVISAAFDEAA